MLFRLKVAEGLVKVGSEQDKFGVDPRKVADWKKIVGIDPGEVAAAD